MAIRERQEPAGPALHHVIVLDGPDSAAFIKAQGLMRPRALIDKQLDSEKLFMTPELLRSNDGIQFYLFPMKYPATNMGHFTGFEHLEKHLGIIEYRLAHSNKSISNRDRHEKIDAIVIPNGFLEKPSTFRWLERMHERHPGLKVIVTNPKTYAPTDPAAADAYIQAKADTIPEMYGSDRWRNVNDNRARYEPLTPPKTLEDGTTEENPYFHVHPQIDMALPNTDSWMQATWLRRAIGVADNKAVDPHVDREIDPDRKPVTRMVPSGAARGGRGDR